MGVGMKEQRVREEGARMGGGAAPGLEHGAGEGLQARGLIVSTVRGCRGARQHCGCGVGHTVLVGVSGKGAEGGGSR